MCWSSDDRKRSTIQTKAKASLQHGNCSNVAAASVVFVTVIGSSENEPKKKLLDSLILRLGSFIGARSQANRL